jgi:hypothetical protein
MRHWEFAAKNFPARPRGSAKRARAPSRMQRKRERCRVPELLLHNLICSLERSKSFLVIPVRGRWSKQAGLSAPQRKRQCLPVAATVRACCIG